jgi:large subunit ribosomal protein L21
MSDMDWAVVESGGKQHLVAAGTRVIVNRLSAKEGDILTLKSLLDETPVAVRVLAHQRGVKINGLKFKSKTRYMRRYGHRQEQTVLEVVSIGADSAVAKPAVKKTENSESGKKAAAPAKAKAKAKAAAAKPKTKVKNDA